MTKRPSWIWSTWVAMPPIGARITVWSRLRCGLAERRLGLGIGRELLERQIGIAEQLGLRGGQLLLDELRAARAR